MCDYMGLLNYDEFVNERLDIHPMSDERLKKESDSLKKPFAFSGLSSNTLCEHSVALRLRYKQFCGILIHGNEHIAHNAYSLIKGRFLNWQYYSTKNELEEHKRYSKIDMPKLDVAMCLWLAFKLYLGDDEYTPIIECYVNRVKKEFGISNKDIINIYFIKQ
jgi:hypothetical protein